MTDLEIELAKELIALLGARVQALIDKIAAHEAAKTSGDPVPPDPTHPKLPQP